MSEQRFMNKRRTYSNIQLTHISNNGPLILSFEYFLGTRRIHLKMHSEWRLTAWTSYCCGRELFLSLDIAKINRKTERVLPSRGVVEAATIWIDEYIVHLERSYWPYIYRVPYPPPLHTPVCPAGGKTQDTQTRTSMCTVVRRSLPWSTDQCAQIVYAFHNTVVSTPWPCHVMCLMSSGI